MQNEIFLFFIEDPGTSKAELQEAGNRDWEKLFGEGNSFVDEA